MSVDAALALHRQGNLTEAERLYHQVLQRAPRDAEALHLLGILCLQTGRAEAAATWIGEALKGNPRAPAAHLNLGVALQALDRLEEALACFERALRLQPLYPDALNNCGDALLALHRPAEALQRLNRALELQPNFSTALDNRGNALRALGRFDEALASYELALRSEPRFVRALNNRGTTLSALRRHTEALHCFDEALEVNPDYGPALYNRGTALLEMRRPEEALQSLQRLAELQPGDVDALTHLGIALLALDRPAAALASFEQALSLRPGLVPALINRAGALQALHRPDEGLVSLQRALQLEPDNAVALNNYAGALAQLGRFGPAVAGYDKAVKASPHDADVYYNRATALRDMGRIDEALRDFQQALQLRPDFTAGLFDCAMTLMRLQRHRESVGYFRRLNDLDPRYPYARGAESLARAQICDWSDAERRRADLVQEVRQGGAAAAPLGFLAVTDSAADQLHCARLNARERYPARPAMMQNAAHHRHDRIRLGYVSGDLRSHAVAHLLVGVIESHDRRRFEVNAISFKPRQAGRIGQRVHDAFDRFVLVGERTDAEAAAAIRAMEIDILIDLAGYTDGHRLGIFAHRPAPVQVEYLGYAGTTGTTYMDYLLADDLVIPAGDERWYTEQIVRLPHCCLPNDDRREVAAKPSRTDAGLPEEGFVFCAFTNPYKINPEMFDVWMRLLGAVPGSVLWLRSTSPDARGNLEREARQRGIDGGRLSFAPFVAEMPHHLARQSLADLYLDTVPYNAHSTACDALWAGVPVLTCAGSGFASRVAASALTAVGLGQLVTDSLRDYERKALELARDAEQLKRLRLHLERNRATAPLFDTARFTRQLESAYQIMNERALRGEPAASFSIEPLPASSG